MKPTAERVRKILEYDQYTGIFKWKFRTDVRGGWNAKCAGKVAGRLDSSGYRQIAVDGQRYFAYKLAWLYMTGEWPLVEIDHRNHVPDDDRFENLRPSTHMQNAYNRRRQSNNTSGYKGVVWNKILKKWQCTIKANKKQIHLGLFTDIEEAANAYKRASMELHGEFSNPH